MRVRRLPFALSLLLSLLAGASFRPALGQSGHDRCLEVLRRAGKDGCAAGFYAIDRETGRVLVKWRHEEPMIPASNMKVLVAAAAVLGLPADHRICTDVLRRGAVEEGVLRGDLILRGEGDPTLKADEVPPAVAAAVARHGIRVVTGDILVDDRLFTDDPRGPSWPKDDPTKHWLALPRALALDHATATVRVDAGGGVGEPARVATDPGALGLRLVNTTRTVASGARSAVWFSHVDGDPLALKVGGTVAAGTRGMRVRGAVVDGGLLFGAAVRASLREAGVEVQGQVRRATAEEGTGAAGGVLLGRLQHSYRAGMADMLQRSRNVSADMLLKHLGAALEGEGSYAGGGRALEGVLDRAEVHRAGLVVADGSGLSRDNRVCARTLAEVLRAAGASEQGEFFRSALAQPGKAGTLRRRLGHLEGRLWAKTGTLRGVSALSGFVRARSGREIVFSALAAGPGAFALRNQLASELARGF